MSEQGGCQRLDPQVLVHERFKVRPLRIHLGTFHCIIELVLWLGIVRKEPVDVNDN